MAVISSIHANVIALNTFQKNLLKWPQEKWPPSPTSQENVINDQPPKSAPLCHGVDYFWLITTISALLLIKGCSKNHPPPPLAPSPNIQAKQHQTVAYYSCLMALKTLTWFPLLSRSFLWREVFSGEGRKLISWTAAGNQAYHKTYYNLDSNRCWWLLWPGQVYIQATDLSILTVWTFIIERLCPNIFMHTQCLKIFIDSFAAKEQKILL